MINSRKELRSECSLKELNTRKQQKGTPGCRHAHAEALKLKYIWAPLSRQ